MIIKQTKNKGLEYIYNGSELYAVIVRDSFSSSSVAFFTDDSAPQQIGFLPHKKGNIIKPHIHKTSKRNVSLTNETLFVKSGRLKTNFYNSGKKFVGSETISKGDVILLCGGGHGFEILEDSIIIEVKQGPYLGINDKEIFEGVEK